MFQQNKISEKLIQNLMRYGTVSIWSNRLDVDILLEGLLQRGINIKELFVDKRVLTRNYDFPIKSEIISDGFNVMSECLLIYAQNDGFKIAQKAFIDLDNSISILNYDSFNDFYFGESGIICKFVREKQSENYVEKNRWIIIIDKKPENMLTC